LHLSRNAELFHPGRGVYRSSYKNAMRLTRTEINMAYRTADFERYQQLPFIKGIDVRLSNNHSVPDICDDLKGKYPKEFLFRGWHPQCRCHVVTILASKDELSKMTDDILSGQEIDTSGVKYQETLPGGYYSVLSKVDEKAKKGSKLPYFLTDNPKYQKAK